MTSFSLQNNHGGGHAVDDTLGSKYGLETDSLGLLNLKFVGNCFLRCSLVVMKVIYRLNKFQIKGFRTFSV